MPGTRVVHSDAEKERARYGPTGPYIIGKGSLGAMPSGMQHQLIHDHRRGAGPSLISAERASLSAPHALVDPTLVDQTLSALKEGMLAEP